MSIRNTNGLTRWLMFICVYLATLPIQAQHGHSLNITETNDRSAADVSFYLQRASELLEQHEYASALRHFMFAGEIEPTLYRQFVFQYKLAKTYRGLHQTEKAITYFSYTAADSIYGDFALLPLGEIYYDMDSSTKAQSTAHDLLQRFPRSTLSPHAYYLLLKIADKTKNNDVWKKAWSDVRSALKNYPKLQIQWEPDILQRQSRYFIRNNDSEQALAILRRLQNDYPYSQEAYEAWQPLFGFYPSKNNPPPMDDFIAALQVRMMQGHHTEALNMIAALRSWYSDAEAHKEIDFMTARIYFSQGRYDLAMPRFANLWSDYASTEALFQMGRAARYAGDIEQSVEAYRQYLQHGKLNDAWSSYIRFEMANNRAIRFDSVAIAEVNGAYRTVYL
ncbi:MAG TPA: tetratricopeptide repeat protein, partial [bacterium]|nr:tetratricopeptide repeat protein [bacterium]